MDLFDGEDKYTALGTACLNGNVEIRWWKYFPYSEMLHIGSERISPSKVY